MDGAAPAREAIGNTGNLMASVTLFAVVGEATIAAAALARLGSSEQLLAAHAAVSCVLAGTAWLLYSRGARDPAFLLLVIVTPIMGPLGALGAAGAVVLRHIFLLRAVPFEQWYATLVPAFENSRPHLLYKRLALRRGEPRPRSTGGLLPRRHGHGHGPAKAGRAHGHC